MSKIRRRVKQTTSLQHRLLAMARHAREAAEDISTGPQKQQMLDKARMAETAAELEQWLRLRSPGLMPTD
jgi:hypothetical protein